MPKKKKKVKVVKKTKKPKKVRKMKRTFTLGKIREKVNLLM